MTCRNFASFLVDQKSIKYLEKFLLEKENIYQKLLNSKKQSLVKIDHYEDSFDDKVSPQNQLNHLGQDGRNSSSLFFLEINLKTESIISKNSFLKEAPPIKRPSKPTSI